MGAVLRPRVMKEKRKRIGSKLLRALWNSQREVRIAGLLSFSLISETGRISGVQKDKIRVCHVAISNPPKHKLII